MYNEITCDKIKHILRENMFYNAINLDTLNYMAEEHTFAGGFCSDDAVIFADSCAHTDSQGVTNNVYVCPLKKNFNYVSAARFVEKTFRAKSISVDVHLFEADTANDVKVRFSSLCPYRREIKDYVAQNGITAGSGPVRALTPEDKELFCDAGFAAMPNRPPVSVLFTVFVEKGAGKILGYFDEQKILGYLSYQCLYENVFDLDYIYVLTEQRGRGIGSALGRQYASYVRSQNGMALWSNARNKESEATAKACGFAAGRRAFLFS